MHSFTRSRPSPAMVLAVFALLFAMVGTAVAGPDALTRAITKSKVKKVSAKQANKAIDQRASGLSVANANTANTANTVANGAVTAPKLGVIVTRVAEVDVADGTGNATNATCQPGERLISGGVRLVGSTADDFQITASRPQTAAAADPVDGEVPTQWRGAGFNPAGGVGTVPLRVFANCIQ